MAAGRASGTKEDARTLNAYLDTLPGRVYEAQRQLIADNEEITISALKQQLGGGTKKKSRMLIEPFENHNNQLAQLVGKGCAEGTLERYKIAKRHTVNFLQWNSKSPTSTFLINYEFATEFEFWLKAAFYCFSSNCQACACHLKNAGSYGS
jgi:hypothetical protein